MKFRPYLWLVSALRPRPLGAVIAGLGLGWLLLSVVFGIAMAEPDLEGVGLFVFTSGAFGGWPALGLLLLSAVFAGGRAPRALLLLVALAVGTYSGLAMLFLGIEEDNAVGLGVFIGVLQFLPFAVLALGVLVATVMGVRQLREDLREARIERVTDHLEARGYGRAEDLAWQLSVASDVVATLVPDNPVVEDVVFDPGFLVRQAELLSGIVTSRQHVHRADLADELGVRDDVVPALLHYAVRSGKLTGWVDWEQGVVHSADVAALRDCPRCAAPMEAAGASVIQCVHCDTELFGAVA